MRDKQKAKEDFLNLYDSIEWWKERANIMIGKIEILEERFATDTATDEDRKIYEDIMKEVETLVARGEVENRELEKMELRITDFLDEDSNDTREA